MPCVSRGLSGDPIGDSCGDLNQSQCTSTYDVFGPGASYSTYCQWTSPSSSSSPPPSAWNNAAATMNRAAAAAHAAARSAAVQVVQDAANEAASAATEA